ncbi:hypothetical protein [Flavobacterium silvaticum]|uniref:Lipoprotein n=1 Tax=Flavobacterium silvaticum TaxID=1852020 RepID=A0A972JIF1_9FLAO|nr:hypothetical protein [Flavobacterium silvaticum]NMH28950.1 hypothetical protein [Flavobacterium silvaticum]
MKVIVYLVTIILVIGCKPDSAMPDDFSFRITHGKQVYDSKSGMLSRKYIKSHTKSVRIELSESQKQAVFDYYRKIGFLSFPVSFECDPKKQAYDPGQRELEIEIVANGINKASKSENQCACKLEAKKERQLVNLGNYIFNILVKSEEYKKLPPTDYTHL